MKFPFSDREYDELRLIPICCCQENSNSGSPENPDPGGNGEELANFTWINLTNPANTPIGNTPASGGGSSNNSGSSLIKNLSNEQFVLDDVLTYLDIQIGEDGTNINIVNVLASNPQVTNAIYLAINGYYDTLPNINDINDVIDLLLDNPTLSLAQDEVVHLLIVEPELIDVVQDFLNDHPNDELAIQVVHDFIALQHCNFDNPCHHTDYPNNLDLIYNFYDQLSSEQLDCLNSGGNEAVLGHNQGTTTTEALLDYMLNLNLSNEQGNNLVDDCCGGSNFESCALETLGLSGQDWIYDEEYWSNPNLSFRQQDLPSFECFSNGFPRNDDGTFMYGADNVYELAGGDVLQVRQDYPLTTNNTCALKVSIALNECGIDIPNIPGSTIQGEDGGYYFLNAQSLNAWMKLTFPNFECYDYTTLGHEGVYNNISGQTGIVIANYGEGRNPSGHADIFDGEHCSVSQATTHCDFGGEVCFWELN